MISRRSYASRSETNFQIYSFFNTLLGTRAAGQLGADIGSAKPTITIRPGYEFRILVTRDLVFSGPYKQ